MSDLSVLCKGVIERIGMTINGGEKNVSVKVNGQKFEYDKELPTHTDAFNEVKYILCESEHKVIDSMKEIDAVGHRIVQGGDIYTHSVLVDDTVVENLRKLSPLAPLHNPGHIQGYEACKAVVGPDVPQVVVFDTAFHSTMPPKAYMYAVPYEWYEKYGIQRFGFHGHSHEYTARHLPELTGKTAFRAISCHLGGSSSLCAIKDGKSVDCSFGFTPQTGLPHAARIGDIDAYIVPFLMNEGMTMEEITTAFAKKSGLYGISGVDSDLRFIEEAANAGNERAKLAIDMFVAAIVRYVGSFYAELGGLDYLTFAGGIGENSATVRRRVCDALDVFGVKIDKEKNANVHGECEISAPDSKVKIYTIATDEEQMVAVKTYEYSQSR